MNVIHIDSIKLYIEGFNVHNEDTAYLGPCINVSLTRDDGNNSQSSGVGIVGGDLYTKELYFNRHYKSTSGGLISKNKTIKDSGFNEWTDRNDGSTVEEEVLNYEFNNGEMSCLNGDKQYNWPIESNQNPQQTTSGNTWTFYIGSQRHITSGKSEIQLSPLYIDNMLIKYIHKDGSNNFGLYNTSNGQIYEYDQKMLAGVTVSVT